MSRRGPRAVAAIAVIPFLAILGSAEIAAKDEGPATLRRLPPGVFRPDARLTVHENPDSPPVAPPVSRQIAGEDRCDAESAPLLASTPEGEPLFAPTWSETLAATIAVETDYELFLRYGSVEGVIAHVEQVFDRIAIAYRRDLGVDLEIGSLEIWAVEEDPFTVESGFLDALNEVGDHWHAEHAGIPRALAHFMSGKTGIAGGIGYHGVLCRADAMVGGHWGGGYSLTGSHGVFGDHRDFFVTAHELGHNFRAYHTHCMNDLPLAGDPPVDHCQSGEIRNDGHACYAGPVEMPADGGSIMSYCHLVGGYSAITLSFGGPGLFGEQSERVLDRMRAHVESAGCLSPADFTLFSDGFESEDSSAWSWVVP